MPEIVLQLAGPHHKHRSAQLSSQALQNLYAERNPDPNEPPVILSFPGCKLWSAGGGVDRGTHVMADVLYQVAGTSLQKVDSAGARTTLATVPGSGYCIFADDGTNLYFVTSGIIYRWSGSALSTVTQSVVTNPQAIDYINRTFIISGDNGLFGTSDVNDGTTYNALNFAEAEVRPDALLRPKQFNQLVYMVGKKTTEVWWYSGSGNPPLSRQDSTLVNVGCSARDSIDNSDQYLYWLGDDNHVYQVLNTSARQITDTALHSEISAFSTVSDAIGRTVVIEGHTFYLLTFPTANKSYFYDQDLNYWGTLSYGTMGARHLFNSYQYAYRKHIVGDYRNGNLYELDKNTYEDNGEVIRRERVTLPITANGRDIVVRKLKLIAESGVGIASGQGVDPQIMMSVSHDKGKTWEAEQWRSMGVMGDYEREIEWLSLGRAESFTFKFAFTDPTAFNLYKAIIQVEYGRN